MQWIQPSVHIPGGTGSIALISVAAAHASHQQPRETLVAIDNVVSVVGVAVSTKVSNHCAVADSSLHAVHTTKVRALYG